MKSEFVMEKFHPHKDHLPEALACFAIAAFLSNLRICIIRQPSLPRNIAVRLDRYRKHISSRIPPVIFLRRKGISAPLRATLAFVFSLIFFFPLATMAQSQFEQASVAMDSLPDAPQPQSEAQGELTSGQASISGVIQDQTGAVVSGATVSLTLPDGRTIQTVTSDAKGEFALTKLASGSYILIVAAKGFSPYNSEEISLAAQQSYVMPDISLGVASAVTEVTVLPTEVLAAQQIKQEEKQRILGIAPNFYVSYEKDAAPMTSRQKLSLAAHDAFDWTSFVGISASAGIEQATNAFSGYGQGVAGYGKRWAAKFADGRSSNFLDHYVFASLFHQDPRYFYQGTGSRKSRLFHAVSYAFVARSDSGKTMPNYSYLFGTMVSGALSNAYYPAANRGASLVFVNAGVGIAGRAGAAVLQEFLGKRLTRNAPKSTP